jgi:lipase
VCLHGIGGHGLRFRRLAERLAPAHRVLAFDLRGHAASSWEPPWDFEAHVRDLLEALDAHGLERCAWIGHSFGGRLALELATRSPGRVERLALLDPALVVPPPIALQYAEGARADPGFASLEEALADARARNEVALPHALELLEEELRTHLVRAGDGRLRFRRCASAVVTAYSEMAKPLPDFALWPRGILIVRGAESHVVPDELVAWVRAGAGEAVEIVTVPGGHSVLWDAFGPTADAIERFLA